MSQVEQTGERLAPPRVARDLPVVILKRPAWKRPLDIVGALAGLVLSAPLMLLAALLVKLTSSGPAVFRQERAGLGGKPFVVYKFRSMYSDAEQLKRFLLPFNEQTGPAFKMKDDPRITPFGRVIRRLSIDELPQLWNVLKGDMSLVGPRPLPCDEVPCHHNMCVPQRQLCRLSVKPGLTCYWQVSGRSEIGFQEWLRLDMRYVREQAFLTDLKLLLLTIPAVLSGRGAT